MDELELSIKHMLWKVISKWRFILICMICGMLAFGAIGAYAAIQSSKTAQNSHTQSSAAYSEKLGALRATLTEYDAQVAENAADYYNMLKKQFEDWVDYKENSVVGKLDFEKVPTMEMMYYVKVSDEDKESSKGQDILRAYLMEIYSGDTYEAILNAMGWDIDPEYVRDLITAVTESGGTMKISVIAESEEDCSTIGQIIHEKIVKLEAQMKEAFGPFELVALEENFTVCEVEDVVVQQKNCITAITLYVDQMLIAGDKLVGNQRSYYDMLIAGPDTQENVVIEQVPQQAGNVSLLNVKYIIVGAVLGIVAGIAIAILQYIFTPCLRRKEDLETVYGAPNLGVLKEKQIDSNMIDLICTNIKAICKKRDIKTICLIGTYKSDVVEKIKEQICKNLSEELESVDCVGSIVMEVESLEKVVEVEAAVIVEKEDASISSEISREIDLCNMHDIAIIGSVVLH